MSKGTEIIKSLFIAEFHQNVGPKIVAQCPLSRDADNDWVVGNCVCLRHEKFPRNSLVFNVCLIVDGESNYSSFENIVQKLSEYMAEIELESQFVSTRLEDPTLQPSLESILSSIYHSLKDNSYCILPIDTQNVWYLKIDPIWNEPPEILDHHVPIPLYDLNNIGLINSFHWKDLAIQVIIPYINGSNFVRRIALLANEDTHTVKLAIQHLIYYKCIGIQDIFQYSNMYQVTKHIREFITSHDLQESCLNSLALSREDPLPDISIIVALYCEFKSGLPLYESNEVSNFNIDIRCFILFGTLHNIIRRVHKYPLERSPVTYSSIINAPVISIIPTQLAASNPENEENSIDIKSGVKRHLNLKKGNIEQILEQVESYLFFVAKSGNYSYDEISTELGLSFGDVDQLFSLSYYK